MPACDAQELGQSDSLCPLLSLRQPVWYVPPEQALHSADDVFVFLKRYVPGPQSKELAICTPSNNTRRRRSQAMRCLSDAAPPGAAADAARR